MASQRHTIEPFIGDKIQHSVTHYYGPTATVIIVHRFPRAWIVLVWASLIAGYVLRNL